MSRIDFKERFPDAEATAADFSNKDWDPGWMDPRGDKESVLIAEYWCVEKIDSDDVALGEELKDQHTKRTWPDGNEYDSKEPREKIKRKPGETHRVVRHLIDGVEELEPPVERPGKIIPRFWVEGDSFWVDGKRYVTSLIRSARDIQRLYNWEATKEVEILAMQATSPYLVTPTMVQNHEQQWQNAPNQNYFYLVYNNDPTQPAGPQRIQGDAPIQAISQAKITTAQEIKDVIGLQDPNLGKASSANQSGIAIQKLRSEGDMATYHFSDNLGRTLKTFCKVLIDWIPFYYDIEHEMEIVTAQMEQKTITVNTAAPVLDEETGQAYQHDMTKGNYQLVVKVEPSYATKREASQAFYSGIIQAVPEAMDVMGDLLFANSDAAGSDDAAERWKRYIALKFPGLIQDDKNAGLPAAANAQMQQMSMQLQQLQATVQQQAMAIKMQTAPKMIDAQSRQATEKTKQQTTIITAMAKIQADLAKAKMDHAEGMYKIHIGEATDAIEHLMQMLHESELPPGPEQGSLGLHPQAIPPPMPPGGAPGASPATGAPNQGNGQ